MSNPPKQHPVVDDFKRGDISKEHTVAFLERNIQYAIAEGIDPTYLQKTLLEVENHALKRELEEALIAFRKPPHPSVAKFQAMEFALEKAFDCCGGNDEDPREHTTDCNRMEVERSTGWKALEAEVEQAKTDYTAALARFAEYSSDQLTKINEQSDRINALEAEVKHHEDYYKDCCAALDKVDYSLKGTDPQDGILRLGDKIAKLQKGLKLAAEVLRSKGELNIAEHVESALN